MRGTNETPTVSVIIPSFNAGQYVAQAVSSALASRDVALEVIVIDDQSTDDTWQVLESFGDRILKVRQERGGPYKARNYGARLARGAWLAFLDADDDWLPDKLIRQLEIADEGTGLVFTDRLNFGDCHGVKERQSDTTPLYDGDIFEPLLQGNFITLSSVLMRKDVFTQLGGFSETNIGVQDWDLWLRYAAQGGSVRLAREPLTRYRIHDQQMTLDLDARAGDRLTVVQRALQSPRGKQTNSRVRRQALAGVWEVGAWQAASSHRGKAIAWFLQAASQWPWNMRLYKGIAKCLLNRD